MYDLSIEYQIDEFMIYCRSRELRAKTLESYEHTLRLFERWCNDELNITQVDQVTESGVYHGTGLNVVSKTIDSGWIDQSDPNNREKDVYRYWR